MQNSFAYLLFVLLSGVSVIVVLTARYKIHPFFALLISSFVTGLALSLPVANIITLVKDGFGNIMRSLGLIIVLGTALGVLLEHTGSTKVMAAFILKKTGDTLAPLSMSITGFIVGLPIFCNSGFIVLSGLNRSLARRTQTSILIMSVALATGLYAVHCLIPPHPGATSAAELLRVDLGRLIVIGICIAIPTAAAGYLYAIYAGKKLPFVSVPDEVIDTAHEQLPTPLQAFLPVIIPIVLIALKSFFSNGIFILPPAINALLIIGDPVIALAIGIGLTFLAKTSSQKPIPALLQDAAEKAGGILVIIGAGGAFGAVLAAANIGNHFSETTSLQSMGLLFPFLLTSVLKTAQGSSTVAIITAASIVQPLLPALGLVTANDQLLATLAMGAGSMMISHANDAFFWVIAKFSGLEMRPMLRVYSVATIVMGIVAFCSIYLLSFVF